MQQNKNSFARQQAYAARYFAMTKRECQFSAHDLKPGTIKLDFNKLNERVPLRPPIRMQQTVVQ